MNSTVNSDTTSFILRAVAITLCAIIFAGFVGMFVTAWHWGDGEGIRIIDAMTGPMLAAFSGLVTFILSHFGSQVVAAIQQTKQVQAQAGAAVATPAAPSAPSAPGVPSAVQGGADLPAPVPTNAGA